MATFKVGDRVRIKWSRNWPELAGQPATIVGVPAPDTARRDGYEPDWLVAPDIWGSQHAPKTWKRGIFGPKSEQLEPLVPPHEAAGWEVVEKLLPNIREKEHETD